MSQENLTFIDLFSGCGGLALGFKQAGFKSVFAVDNDKASALTYEKNFGHPVYLGNIEELKSVPSGVDFIIGGPPCQGFSPLGKMSPSKKHPKMNKLWQEYLRIVDMVKPRGFVVENVPEFLDSEEFKIFKEEIKKRNYNIKAHVLNAAEFGVPQSRKRGFTIALKDRFPVFPAPVSKQKTVRDAIGDLPLKPDGKNWHIGRSPTEKSLERYKCVPKGGNRFDLMRKRPDITPDCWLNKPAGSTDVFGRLWWDRPSVTIRTEFFKPEKGRYLHPEANRPITHREAARLQTFPDNFEFVGSKTEVARMIGNAVPPTLALNVALAVKKVLNQPEKTVEILQAYS